MNTPPPIRFIYITDFHGDVGKYDEALKAAQRLGVKTMVNGGDMGPHQYADEFFADDFRHWLLSCRDAGISNLGMFGNDDYLSNLPLLDELEKEGLFRRVDGRVVQHEGWIFWGYNFVPEYPFRLKDWVKRDAPATVDPRQHGEPVTSASGRMEIIGNIELYHQKRGSIRDDLESVRFVEPQRTIAVIHSPPYGVGLDVTYSGREVGSVSVLDFLRRERPYLSLHGHIHESSEISGVWKVQLGETLACNPGPRVALIELGNGARKLSIIDRKNEG